MIHPVYDLRGGGGACGGGSSESGRDGAAGADGELGLGKCDDRSDTALSRTMGIDVKKTYQREGAEASDRWPRGMPVTAVMLVRVA